MDQEVYRFCALARKVGLEVTVLTDLQKACSLAERFHAEGRLRGLVGVGGDGTAAELVNQTASGVPITLLAAGTGNLFARHFGLATNAEQLCRVVTAGRVIRVDAGSASGRLFLVMAGCGLDGEVARRMHLLRAGSHGGHISYASYLKPIVQSLRSYQYPEFRVYCDAGAEGPANQLRLGPSARWAFACNLPRYGWGLPLAPLADGTDGLLDLYTFKRGRLWHGLRYLVAVQLGLQTRLADCTWLRVRHLRLESDHPVPYQVDGDPGGVLPLEVTVVPGRVSLVVPPGRSKHER